MGLANFPPLFRGRETLWDRDCAAWNLHVSLERRERAYLSFPLQLCRSVALSPPLPVFYSDVWGGISFFPLSAVQSAMSRSRSIARSTVVPLQSPSPLRPDFRAGLTKQPLNFFHPMADVVVVVVSNRQTYLLPSLLLPPSHSLAVFLFDRKKFAPVTAPFLVRSPAKKKGWNGEGERIHNGYEVIGFLF